MAQGKINGSNMSGPIRSQVMSNGLKTLGRSAVVTVTALAAAAEETYTITDADAFVGDVINVSPGTTLEAGWGTIAQWVSADGTISVKASNFGVGALTGGSLTLYYTITR